MICSDNHRCTKIPIWLPRHYPFSNHEQDTRVFLRFSRNWKFAKNFQNWFMKPPIIVYNFHLTINMLFLWREITYLRRNHQLYSPIDCLRGLDSLFLSFQNLYFSELLKNLLLLERSPKYLQFVRFVQIALLTQ